MTLPPQGSFLPLSPTLSPTQLGWFSGYQPLGAPSILHRTFLQGFWFCPPPPFHLLLTSLPHLNWELASPPLSLLAARKSSSPSTASQNNTLHSMAIRSCLSRSLLHSLLWCELKHQGPRSCWMPWLWQWPRWLSQRVISEKEIKPRLQTIGTLGIYFGKFGLPSQFLPAPLKFP